MRDVPIPYVLLWVAALLASAVAVTRRPARYAIFHRRYARFLLRPWKILCALSAALLLIGVAPYSGDPTWDAGDSILTSALVFWGAPWAVGVGARALARRSLDPRLPVAFVALFLPCIAYDLYIWARDGHYAAAWAPNVALSGGIALLAGLFFNLEHRGFAFARRAWPPRRPRGLGRGAYIAGLLAAPVIAMIAAFVILAR